MREIKFRCWDKKDKKMLQFCAIGIDEFKGIYLPESYRKNSGQAGLSYVGNYPNDFILLQFTGLLDKNGKEIYDGDIISNETTYNLEVFWMGLGWGLRFKDMDELCEEIIMDDGGNMIMEGNKLQYMKIIGNRFENPELYDC